MQRRLERAIEELRFGEVEGIFDLMITNDCVEPAYKMLRDFIVEVNAYLDLFSISLDLIFCLSSFLSSLFQDIEALKKIRGM